MTILTIFDNLTIVFLTILKNATLETLITILSIQNLNSVNLCDLTIKSDTGQHLQFLRKKSRKTVERKHVKIVNLHPISAKNLIISVWILMDDVTAVNYSIWFTAKSSIICYLGSC